MGAPGFAQQLLDRLLPGHWAAVTGLRALRAYGISNDPLMLDKGIRDLQHSTDQRRRKNRRHALLLITLGNCFLLRFKVWSKATADLDRAIEDINKAQEMWHGTKDNIYYDIALYTIARAYSERYCVACNPNSPQPLSEREEIYKSAIQYFQEMPHNQKTPDHTQRFNFELAKAKLILCRCSFENTGAGVDVVIPSLETALSIVKNGKSNMGIKDLAHREAACLSGLAVAYDFQWRHSKDRADIQSLEMALQYSTQAQIIFEELKHRDLPGTIKQRAQLLLHHAEATKERADLDKAKAIIEAGLAIEKIDEQQKKKLEDVLVAVKLKLAEEF